MFGCILVVSISAAALTILTSKFYSEVLLCMCVDLNQNLVGAALVSLCPVFTVGHATVYLRHTIHPLGAILHLNVRAYTCQTRAGMKANCIDE